MILVYILTAYLLINVVYYLVYTIAGNFSTPSFRSIPVSPKRIAVFIPAYKEDGIIVDTAYKSTLQRYPDNQFDVYIIADSLQPETLGRLAKLPVRIIEVSFEKSTKAKAINRAYETIREHYDIVVVLDADNVMEDQFLAKVNHAYQSGHMAIQAHRVAKNSENKLAVMDGVSEEINNLIFRKGHQNLGLSSALIGSGMAFDFNLFKRYMSEIDAVGGFDKALELAFLKSGIKIHYLEDALVFDEKVSSDKTFTRQRTRWIAAQIRYGIHSFGDALFQLVTRGNADYFDKSLQFLLLPRLILLGVLGMATLLGVATLDWIWITVTSGMLITYMMTLIMAMPSSMRKASVYKAVTTLPRTFLLMLVALLGYRKAKDNFLHTPHNPVS